MNTSTTFFLKSFLNTVIFSLLCVSCSLEPQLKLNFESYFPPKENHLWDRYEPKELGWNEEALQDLERWIESTDTRALVILKNGRIAFEYYYGKNLVSTADFNENTFWYWASAGKSATATLVGIAQQEGYLDISEPSTKYLGEGWTSLPQQQENLITIKNQLSMTTGLSENVDNPDCWESKCLVYSADPGSRWAYHNAPYTLLDSVISVATNTSFENYFKEKIGDPIGMKFFWNKTENNILYSDALSMARFGLLILNNGQWEDKVIYSHDNYFQNMTQSSQDLNQSYGYLWWLNGQSNYMLPGAQFSFNGPICPEAPNEMFAAIGKNGQILNIIPEERLVIVRLGANNGAQLVPIAFQEEMWAKLNNVGLITN